MKEHGKWSGWMSRFYYATGAVYYFYHLFLAGGGLGILISPLVAYLDGPVLFAIVFVVALTSTIMGISFGRRVAKVRFHSLNPCLRVKSIKIDYYLISDVASDYVREVHAEVAFPVDNYRTRFLWSGQGKVICSPIKGATKAEIVEETGSLYSVCRVDFGEQLPKGREHGFVYKQQFSEATKPVRPFLGHTLDCRPKELTLRVHLMPNQKVRSYRRQILASVTSGLCLWEQTVQVDNPEQRLLEWNVSKIMHNFYYRIVW